MGALWLSLPVAWMGVGASMGLTWALLPLLPMLAIAALALGGLAFDRRWGFVIARAIGISQIGGLAFIVMDGAHIIRAAVLAGTGVIALALTMPARAGEPRPLWRRLIPAAALGAVFIIGPLALREWALETCQVVSSSMRPTLTAGDRVMVVKGAGIERFDVVAFRMPWPPCEKYVKRVVGLPDEEIFIDAGNLWVRRIGAPRFELARMPAPVWIPSADDDDGWTLPTRNAVLRGRDHVIATGELGDELLLRMDADVRAGSRWSIQLAGAYGTAVVRFGAAPLLLWSGESQRSVPFPTIEGRHRLELSVDDGVVRLSIDGAVAAEIEFLRWHDDVGPSLAAPSAALIGEDPEGPTLRSVRLFRGVAWKGHGAVGEGPAGALRVPPNAYVMLGDNVERSRDSRDWAMVTWTRGDGRVVETEASGVGTAGIESARRPAPFIERQHIIGRVVERWWPIDRAGAVRRSTRSD